MVTRLEPRSGSFLFGPPLALILLVLSSAAFLGATFATTTTTDQNGSGSGDDDRDKTTNTCEASTTATSNRRPQFQLHPQDSSLYLYHFESTQSTQDEAKRMAEEQPFDDSSSFCVTATEQTKGRGTNSRQWMGAPGNTFVTIGIRQHDWLIMSKNHNAPLTLLPLKIGSLVASHVQRLLLDCHQSTDVTSVTVKWPNDVLVEERKISGVLIESSSNGWYLIGIGVNLAYAPPVATTGPNHGRPSTSVKEVCDNESSSTTTPTTKQPSIVKIQQAQQLGVDLAYDLHSFLHHHDKEQQQQQQSPQNGKQILDEWKGWVDWDMELVLRDTPQQERVRLLDVLPDGRVQVVGVENGVQQTLVSDYFL